MAGRHPCAAPAYTPPPFCVAGGALNGFVGIVEAGFYPADVLVSRAPLPGR
jgi:hypothetical protein